MAKDEQDQGSTATAPAPVKRAPSTFTCLVNAAPEAVDALIAGGAKVWVELPAKQSSITGEGAKKQAAKDIFAGAEDDPLKIAIGGDGVAVQAVSTRMWKPMNAKVEAQEPKLHVG